MLTLPADLVLGSTSVYRAALLRRLLPAFSIARPEVDETPFDGEAPLALAVRLAREKCLAVSAKFPSSIVIGADQVADRNGASVGKAGNRANAIIDLQKSSGQKLHFHSAVCVQYLGEIYPFVDTTICHFRTLTTAEIIAYLDTDQPFDCAGSIKTESLGISLLQRMESNDPTGVIGLPLIALGRVLRGLVAPRTAI